MNDILKLRSEFILFKIGTEAYKSESCHSWLPMTNRFCDKRPNSMVPIKMRVFITELSAYVNVPTFGWSRVYSTW